MSGGGSGFVFGAAFFYKVRRAAEVAGMWYPPPLGNPCRKVPLDDMLEWSAALPAPAGMHPASISTKAGFSDERHTWSIASRRRGRTALSPHARSRQTGCALWRTLPHHRHHSLQLHQLRPAQGLHPDAVQGALAEPAHPRRVDGHCGPGAGRVLRADAAHAAHRLQLVHGHCRRRLPEHLFDRQRAAQAHDHPVRRPHLQDGLQPHAGVPQGDQGRGHAGHAARFRPTR